MTNQEINETVAKRFGWVQCCNPKTMENGKIVDCFGWSKGGSHFHEPYPNYSGSIQAAWEIVEFKRQKYAFEIHSTPNEYIANFSGPTWKQVETGKADTAPLAICKAFLKLP